MNNQLLCVQMPIGHPYSKNQVDSLFSSKEVTSKWRKAPNVKKILVRSKSFSLDKALTQAIHTTRELGDSVVNLCLSMPDMREEIGQNWKESWPDITFPELYSINRFCKKRHNKPFMSLNKDSLLSELSEKERLIIPDDEHSDAIFYFLNLFKRGGHNFHMILPDVFEAIKEDPDNKLAHEALWAICSNKNCSLPIQYILNSYPNCSQYYSFLNWYTIETSEVNFEFDPTETDRYTLYNDAYNFYNHFPYAGHLGVLDAHIGTVLEHLVSTFAVKKIQDNASPFLTKETIDDYIPHIDVMKDGVDSIERHILKNFSLFLDKALSPIEEYVKSRESLANNSDEEFLDYKLPIFDPQNYQTIKSNILEQKDKDVSLITALFNKNLVNDCKRMVQRIADPFNGAKETVATYKELSKSPLKNRVRLGEILEEMNTAIEKGIESVKNEDAFFHETVTKIDRLVQHYASNPKNSTDDKELVEILESELSEKSAEISDLNKLIADLKEKIEKPTLTTVSIDTESAGTGNASIETIKHMIRELGASPEQVLAFIEKLHEDKVVILPSAIQSSRDASNFKQVTKMFEVLNILATGYYQTITSGMPDSEARKCFASKIYAANESQTVSGNARLMKHRTFHYNGEDTVMEQHLIIGTSRGSTETMRIYFKIIDNKIVIGHAGEHLPTKSCK